MSTRKLKFIYKIWDFQIALVVSPGFHKNWDLRSGSCQNKNWDFRKIPSCHPQSDRVKYPVSDRAGIEISGFDPLVELELRFWNWVFSSRLKMRFYIVFHLPFSNEDRKNPMRAKTEDEFIEMLSRYLDTSMVDFGDVFSREEPCSDIWMEA